ncbi:MAG: histidine kinase [Oscillatoria sp. SIO1A7]|nr:histidine kinase [Oscillatoria sp. SIO1A7]
MGCAGPDRSHQFEKRYNSQFPIPNSQFPIPNSPCPMP